MKRARVLIVEDDARARESLQALLNDEGYDVESASDGLQALQLLRHSEFDATLLDIRMPGKDGLGVLRDLRDHSRPPAILVMTAFGTSDVAIEAMKLGAYDYLTKPIRFDELLIQLKRSITNRLQAMTIETYPDEGGAPTDFELVGDSSAMRRVYKLIGQVAATDSTVLILGESGTGKELIARAIHAHSTRKFARLITVHCAAIPDTLLEAELFGYEKGAFTGAAARRRGKFETADGGTIFLDEIGELSLPMQVKLLRVLQERTIEPLGSERSVTLDIRIVAATNTDLKQSIQKGTFREDLFYRLNVVTIEAPPLSDRRDDIPGLCAHILRKLVSRRKLPPSTLTADAIDTLKSRSWPGNVRELEHVLERAVILSRGAPIGAELLVSQQPAGGADPFGELTLDEGFHGLVRKLERSLVTRALDQAKGNRSRAAEILKINRRLLYDKLQEFGIEQEDR
ncbi:MAG: sigma-54-dependent transcriptional regulator [Vicinamibacterales bacterium]